MNKNSKKTILLMIVFFLAFNLFQNVIAEKNDVSVEFFYTDPIKCDACNQTKPLINEIERYYKDNITLQRFFVVDDPDDENYSKLEAYLDDVEVPTIVVKYQNDQNHTIYKWGKIKKSDFEETLKSKINDYINGNISKNPMVPPDDKDNTPGFVIALILIVITFFILLKKKYS